MRLSEKRSERLSEDGFGRYEESQMDRKGPLRWPVRLRCIPIRAFSDRLSTTLVNRDEKRKGRGPTFETPTLHFARRGLSIGPSTCPWPYPAAPSLLRPPLLLLLCLPPLALARRW